MNAVDWPEYWPEDGDPRPDLPPLYYRIVGRTVKPATAEAMLYEGGDTTGRVLWRTTLAHVVDLSDGRGQPPTGGTDWIPVAVRKFAQKALQALPMRDPRAVHAQGSQ